MNMTNAGFNTNHHHDHSPASGNQTAISGGRKPTADNQAYPLYKQQGKVNTRGKFSNGGGSIGGINEGVFEQGFQNNSIILMEKNQQMGNFSTGPNTTASRFYNPK